MHVHVLGSGAGGGFPQWNCGCANCRGVRDGSLRATPRTQSSIVVSADGVRWALLNASPDVRTQVNGFPPLAPPAGARRGSGIACVLLTNADIDHCAGFLVLREGGAPPLYTTERVRAALTEGLSILPALTTFSSVDWRRIEPERPFALAGRDGKSIGVRVEPFAVASKAPPYFTPGGDDAADEYAGDTIGLLLSAESSPGKTLAYVPGVRVLDERLREYLARADIVLIDGTFWTDDELSAPGVSKKTARMMGHAPITGDGGLMEFLATLTASRKVLIHINNTNPILNEDSPERAELTRAGIEVAHDGMGFELVEPI